MSYTARIAAIKTAISNAIDAQVAANGNKTPTVRELETAVANAIATLHASGAICGVSAVVDA